MYVQYFGNFKKIGKLSICKNVSHFTEFLTYLNNNLKRQMVEEISEVAMLLHS